MEKALLIILPVILALVATVLAFIFIVPEKKRARLNKFGKFLHDTVNFKYLIVEKILQASYIFATAFVILAGFFMLFYVQEGYSGYYISTPDVWYGGYGLLLMIVGPIVIRIVYEFTMMAILLIKNVIQINSQLKADDGEDKDIFSVPAEHKEMVVQAVSSVSDASASAPQALFCTGCGAALSADDVFCGNCGQKMR